MTVDTSTQPIAGPSVEPGVEEFAGQLFDVYTKGMLTLMIDIADRTGLLQTLAGGPGTSAGIAERARLTERYVRECLGALVTGGIVEYDAAAHSYALPPERAVCLAGEGSLNMAPMSRVVGLLAKTLPEVAQAFRRGGGVPYERFRPEFTGVMDGISRGFFDGQLIHGVLPLAGDLPDRLAEGIEVADIGCGSGHSTNLLAKNFPASTFVGYDISDDALTQARVEAKQYALSNVTFENLDVRHLPDDVPLDAVFAFDAIHDQVDPAAVLDRVYAALKPGGVFVMFDIRASSHLENNLANPMAPLLYAVSTLHCLTVSLAHGGAGLGTVWGEELARSMLAAAGFAGIQVHEVPDDPLDSLYVASKPLP
jgi:SAM-dependent methyltransferase